jgi:ATP-binding cassette subfamily B protein
MIAAVLAKLAKPWPLKLVIDHLVPVGGLMGSGVAVIDALEPMTLLARAANGLLVAIGLHAILEYLATIAFALAGARVLTRVPGDLFRHLQALPLSYHQQARTGDLAVRLIADIGFLKETAVTAAMPLPVNTLVLAGMVALRLSLDWQLALLALLPPPLLWLSTLGLPKRRPHASRRSHEPHHDGDR